MKTLLFSLLFALQIGAGTPVKEALNGSMKSKIEVTTEFAESAYAVEEVAKNKAFFHWMDGGSFTFAKAGTFTYKKKGQETETGRFAADETRVKLVFDNTKLPELNAYNPQLNKTTVILPFGVGMTKVILYLQR